MQRDVRAVPQGGVQVRRGPGVRGPSEGWSRTYLPGKAGPGPGLWPCRAQCLPVTVTAGKRPPAKEACEHGPGAPTIVAPRCGAHSGR